MGLKDKLLNFVAPPIDDEDEEYMEEVEVTREVRKPVQRENVSRSSKSSVAAGSNQMFLFEPRTFDEAEDIARHLKKRTACVVNLHRLQRDYAQRTIDFLTGTVFALDGTIQKIAHNTILLTPSNIGVGGEISLEQSEE